MQAQEGKVGFETCIDTANGQATLQSLQPLTLFGHEYLQHVVSPNPAPEITLQSLRDHLLNPYTLPNTSLSPSFIAHQFKDLPLCLIVDCSKSLQVDTLLSKATILKGYWINIKPNIPANEAKALYDEESLRKKLQIDFTMNQIKPAFIGEISLRGLDLENQYVRNLVKVYSQFSEKTGCPIWVNCIDSSNWRCVFEEESSNVKELYEKIDKFLELVSQKVREKIILFNPPIVIVQEMQGDDRILVENSSSQKIVQLRLKYHLTIGYDLLRYNSNPYILRMLSKQIQQYPQNTVLSAGVLFKTDTVTFGGQGYYLRQTLKILNLPQTIFQKVFKDNYLKLLHWRKKKIQIIQVHYWKCIECGKQQPQTVKNFKKFQKIFCSVPCVRNHKF